MMLRNGSTAKIVTQFCSLLFKIFQFLERFWTTLRLLVCRVSETRSTFSHFPENHRVVSFMFFHLDVYIYNCGHHFTLTLPVKAYHCCQVLVALTTCLMKSLDEPLIVFSTAFNHARKRVRKPLFEVFV